jgi:hypothetical protein
MLRGWPAALLAAIVVLGCESAAERAIVPVAPGSLTLLFSADNQGVLSACGCPSNPSGGLAKRQTIIDKYRRVRPDALMLDAGDLFPERPNAVKVDYLMIALGKARYTAIAVGDQELGMGLPLLRKMVEQHGLPLISANVRGSDGKLLFPGHVIAEAGGRRVGVFAVLSDKIPSHADYDWRKGLTIDPPIDAARREVKALAGCDVVVALSHQTLEETKALAAAAPGITVIVSGHDPAIFREPGKAGGAMLVGTGPVGRVLGALTFAPKDAPAAAPKGEPQPPVAHALSPLSEKVQDCRWVMDLYWAYVKKAKGEPPPPWFLTPPPPRYEPPEDCEKCHKHQYAAWLTTGHSHAYATIKKVKRHEDPECVLCHTMGYGRKSGFFTIEETPGLANVSCQTCHPVTADHYVKKAAILPKDNINARLCISCHGLIESPNFDYYKYLAKVSHGPDPDKKKPGAADAPAAPAAK